MIQNKEKTYPQSIKSTILRNPHKQIKEAKT
jgi:hypothetical protein